MPALKLFIQKLNLGKLVPKFKFCQIWILLNLVRLENFHTGQFQKKDVWNVFYKQEGWVYRGGIKKSWGDKVPFQTTIPPRLHVAVEKAFGVFFALLPTPKLFSGSSPHNISDSMWGNHRLASKPHQRVTYIRQCSN